MLSLQGRSAQLPGTISQPSVSVHLSAHARWVGCLRLPACQWIYVFNSCFRFPWPQHFSGSCLNALWLSLSLVLPLCPSVWQRTISPGRIAVMYTGCICECSFVSCLFHSEKLSTTVCSPSSALETYNKSNRVKWAHTSYPPVCLLYLVCGGVRLPLFNI